MPQHIYARAVGGYLKHARITLPRELHLFEGGQHAHVTRSLTFAITAMSGSKEEATIAIHRKIIEVRLTTTVHPQGFDGALLVCRILSLCFEGQIGRKKRVTLSGGISCLYGWRMV